MKKIGYIVIVKIQNDKTKRILSFDSQGGYRIKPNREESPVVFKNKRDVTDGINNIRNTDEYPKASTKIVPVFIKL